MIQSKPVIQPKPVVIDSIRFGGKYEGKIYLRLKRYVALNQGLRLSLQPKILLKPPSRNFPAIYWKCDFKITSNEQGVNPVFIEAKGMDTREFTRVIKFVDYLYPQVYDNLIIVYSTRKNALMGTRKFKGLTCCTQKTLEHEIRRKLEYTQLGLRLGVI